MVKKQKRFGEILYQNYVLRKSEGSFNYATFGTS